MQLVAKTTALILIVVQRGVLAMPPAPHSAATVDERSMRGAFHGTELDLQLRRRQIRAIVLGGIATNMGVESTARSAAEHGYELVIAEDLCSALDADMHAFSFRQILPRLARITSSEGVTLG